MAAIVFPFEDDKLNNTFLKKNITTKESVKSQVLLLLYSATGERYYKPSWGSKFKRFLFDPNDTMMKQDILDDLRTSFGKFLPNIKIADITTNEETYNDVNTILVEVRYIYSDQVFNDEDSVRLRFNLEK
jgi:phage baseplate assembly protein W